MRPFSESAIFDAEEEYGKDIVDKLNRMQGKGRYCRNPHGDVLQYPDLPEGTRAIFYTHYIPSEHSLMGKPAITVALLFDPMRLRFIARGVSICSPEENAIKKEGRIRAVGRALRAWNKKMSGPMFVHPRSETVIRQAYIPEGNSFVFTGYTTYKYAWQPPLTRYEEEIIHKALAASLRRDASDLEETDEEVDTT